MAAAERGRHIICEIAAAGEGGGEVCWGFRGIPICDVV